MLIWLEIQDTPKNIFINQEQLVSFSRVTCFSPHVFLNRTTHSAKNKHVFFPYGQIWPYKKLQTKLVAHDFEETFLRSVSLVTALILT